jgi:hypothetical protein
MALAAAFAALNLNAQGTPATAPQDRSIHLQHVSQPPRIADFAFGRDVPGYVRITDFRQNYPSDGKPVSRETSAWIAWGDRNLYAVFLCREDQGRVRARLSRREDIESDDQVGIYLDTFHDQQRVFSFYVNPLGIQADSIGTEGQDEDYNWDTVWQSEGHLTDEGYAVSISIPFRSLRFPRDSNQVWGIALARFIPSRNEGSYWPLYSSRKEGFASQLATLDGLTNISPGRNLQFIPYALGEATHSLNVPDTAPPAWTQENRFEAGIDTKIILRDALTLDLTVNPDFSQVETEDPQTTVNQRFEIYFPEKRPFFLDNASYFQTPENLFFSRNIVDPEFGARLTGKTGPWLLGFLAIDDRAPGLLVAPTDPLYKDHARIAVARIAHDIGQQSSIGVLATAYQFGSNTEINLSVDTRLKLTPNLVLSAQAVRSQTHGMGFARVFGADYYANLTWSSLHISSTTKFLDRSPNFDSYLGFIPRVNIRQVEQDAAYKWHPERVFKSLGPQLTLIADWDHSSALQDWLVTPAFSLELARQTYFTVGRTESLEVYANIPFRKHSTDVSIISEFSKTFAISANYGTGARVNYYPGGELLPFAAPGRDLNIRLTIRPRTNIKIDETYILSRLSTYEQSLIAEQYGNAVLFNSHLLRQTVNWQFTRPLSLRFILDYDAVLPNQSLINLDRSKHLSANVLLTWLLRPGTAFYAGYTDIRENLALDSGVINTIGNPNTTTGRQVFVKFSYLFRY